MRTIITVCNGNIHRSIIAQLCLNRELKNLGLAEILSVSSRSLQGTMGTPQPKYPNLPAYGLEWSLTKPCLDEIGVSLNPNQVATPIDEATVARAALILAMDRTVLYTKKRDDGTLMGLIYQFPRYSAKMRLFMELVGKHEDVLDCFSSNNPALHRCTVMTINDTAREGISTAVRWINAA